MHSLLFLVFALTSSTLGTVALLPDGVLTTTERALVADAVRAAGYTLLEDEEVLAAVDVARAHVGSCGHDDVPCLAKIALLAEADAVVAFSRRDGVIHIVAVDAAPRSGRASTEASDVGRAVVEALAAREAEAQPVGPAPVSEPAPEPVVAPPPRVEPRVEPVTPAAPAAAPAPSPSPPVENAGSLWGLAGAGLAGAGLVALAAGGYAGVLATESMAAAEAAPFQDDAARFGDDANARLWLGGGALALGIGAIAGGTALVLLDGGAP